MDWKDLEKSGRYEELILKLKEELKENIRILENPYIKTWLGKRWRNIFIHEASLDENAVKSATQKKIFGEDTRSDKEKVAYRFLRAEGPEEWKYNFPTPPEPVVKEDTLVFCPGLLSGLLPVMAFKEEFPRLKEKFGIRILQADSHPMRTCEANMQDLLAAIEHGKGLDENTEPIPEEKAVAPNKMIVLSYSKGTADLLVLLAKRPEIASRIKAIFNWAGAPGGSYLANDIYNSIKDMKLELNLGVDLKAEYQNILKVISPVVTLPKQVKRLHEYDIQGAMLDLTTEKRAEFLEENLAKIDALNIPIFNLTGSTTIMEVPYFQIQGVMKLNKFDANNDMQVIQRHSKISCPMATDLAMLHAHHWDMSYGPFPRRMRFGSPNLDHSFPRFAGLSAIVKFSYELGLLQ